MLKFEISACELALQKGKRRFLSFVGIILLVVLGMVGCQSLGPSTPTTTGQGGSSGQVAISPVPVNFGSVVVGSSRKQSVTLSASNSAVTVTSASSDSPQFSLSGQTFPFTIGAGQSVQFVVKFSPQATGAVSANVSFTSNAPSVSAVPVTGTGTAASSHTVDLFWTASTSAVVGYYVYRGNTSGGPYTMLNPMLDGGTSYTDDTVQSGQTYFYVVRAVDSNNVESAYSNESSAAIPNP